MDEIITAVIGTVIFSAFVAGLAESIGAWPFILIVAVVILLVGVDASEVIRAKLKERKSE